MPIRAIADGEEVFADNFISAKEIHCPNCEQPMIFVNPMVDIIKHFRHKVKCKYSTEPESREHVEMKGFFCRTFAGAIPEVKIGNNIADVVVDNIAIECQVSLISMRELIERTEGLNKNGYHVVWVLHPKNFLKRFTWVKPRKIEKLLHKTYYGRVYYFFGDHIKAAHFGFEYGLGLGRAWRLLSLVSSNKDFKLNIRRTSNDNFKIATLGDGVWWK